MEANKKKCVLCRTNINDILNLGEMKDVGGICAHHFCLLLASTLTPSFDRRERVLGITATDIIEEVMRARKRLCDFCTLYGATIMCGITTCRAMFHLPCGLKNDTGHQFYRKYISHCTVHRAMQVYMPPTDPQFCVVCYQYVNFDDWQDVLRSTCCCMDFYHRRCAQQRAFDLGSALKCTSCGSIDYFQRVMRQFGVYVPEPDMPPVQGNLTPAPPPERECTVEFCRCPLGRRVIERAGHWAFTICYLCCIRGTHLRCSNIKSGDAFICALCATSDGGPNQSLEKRPIFHGWDQPGGIVYLTTMPAGRQDGPSTFPAPNSISLSPEQPASPENPFHASTRRTATATAPEAGTDPFALLKSQIAASLLGKNNNSSSAGAAADKSGPVTADKDTEPGATELDPPVPTPNYWKIIEPAAGSSTSRDKDSSLATGTSTPSSVQPSSPSTGDKPPLHRQKNTCVGDSIATDSSSKNVPSDDSKKKNASDQKQPEQCTSGKSSLGAKCKVNGKTSKKGAAHVDEFDADKSKEKKPTAETPVKETLAAENTPVDNAQTTATDKSHDSGAASKDPPKSSAPSDSTAFDENITVANGFLGFPKDANKESSEKKPIEPQQATDNKPATVFNMSAPMLAAGTAPISFTCDSNSERIIELPRCTNCVGTCHKITFRSTFEPDDSIAPDVTTTTHVSFNDGNMDIDVVTTGNKRKRAKGAPSPLTSTCEACKQSRDDSNVDLLKKQWYSNEQLFPKNIKTTEASTQTGSTSPGTSNANTQTAEEKAQPLHDPDDETLEDHMLPTDGLYEEEIVSIQESDEEVIDLDGDS